MENLIELEKRLISLNKMDFGGCQYVFIFWNCDCISNYQGTIDSITMV